MIIEIVGCIIIWRLFANEAKSKGLVGWRWGLIGIATFLSTAFSFVFLFGVVLELFLHLEEALVQTFLGALAGYIIAGFTVFIVYKYVLKRKESIEEDNPTILDRDIFR